MATGWRGLWTARRARLWLAAAIAAAWLPALGVPLRGWLDFAAFYSAGKQAFTPDLYTLSSSAGVVAYELAHDLPIVPFVYPAGVALFYAPLAALPYDLAAALHLAIQFGALVAAAWIGGPAFGLPRRWAVLGTLAWAPASAGVLSGQNTAVALLLVALVVRAGVKPDPRVVGPAKTGSPGLAGLPVGALLYKPQLGLPLVALLAWRGAWRALAFSLVALAAWYIAGVVATGGDTSWPSRWLVALDLYRPADLAANGWQAVSLPLVLERLDLAVGLTTPGSLPVGLTVLGLLGNAVGALVVAMALPALRRWPWERAVALTCAVGLLVSPHAWVYDATLLLPAMAVLAADATVREWPWQQRWRVAGAFLLAAAWPLGAVAGFTTVVAIVMLAPLALLRRHGGLAEGSAAPVLLS